MAWALLGPSVVLLIQIETLFVIADAFGAIPLRAGVSRWTVGTAVALFFLVCVAQLAAFLWRANRDRREKRLDDRMEMEARLARELDKPSIQPEGNPSPGLLVTERSVDALERFVRDEKQARRIIARFGLEPTWAYQALNELGAPDAVRITRQAKLADARSAGGMITPPLGGLLIIAFILSLFLPGSRSATTVTVLLGVVAAVVPLLGWWGMLAWSKPAIKRNEEQYYPLLERLFELRRFDLYRALSLRMPVDASDEQQLSVAAWRRSHGNVRYAFPVASAEQGEARADAQELADLLRGPQLVGYEGFLSWEVASGRTEGDGQVLLTFAGTPVTGAVRNSPIHVEGASTEADAPFNITANSQDVVLSLVKTTVQAPVDGRAVTAAFAFTKPQDSESSTVEAVIWLEIRQRGRFIQLLRIDVGDRHAASA